MDVEELGGRRKRADLSKRFQNQRPFSLPWRRRGEQQGIIAETADSVVQQQGFHLQLHGTLSGNGGSRKRHYRLQCIGRTRENVRSSQMENIVELMQKLLRGEQCRPYAVAECNCRDCFALEWDCKDGRVAGGFVMDRPSVVADVDGDIVCDEGRAISCITRVCHPRSMYSSCEMEEQHVLDMDCRRCLFLTYVGAAGLRLVRPSAYWPVFELLLVSLMPVHPHRHTRRTIPKWRLWSHVALKIGVAVSTRFCCPLLGPFLTAHALLSLRDLRVNHNCRVLPEGHTRSKDGPGQLCSAALDYSALNSKGVTEWQALEVPCGDAGALFKASANDDRCPLKRTPAISAIEVEYTQNPEERKSALLSLGPHRSQIDQEGQQQADSRMSGGQGLYPQVPDESPVGDVQPACILPPAIKTFRVAVQNVGCGDVFVANSTPRIDDSVESPTAEVFFDALTCADCALMENHEENLFKDRFVGQEVSKFGETEENSFQNFPPMDETVDHCMSERIEGRPCSLQSNPSACAMPSAGGVDIMVPPFPVDRLSGMPDITSEAGEPMSRSEVDCTGVGIVPIKSCGGQSYSRTQLATMMQLPESGSWSDDRPSDSPSTAIFCDEDGSDDFSYDALKSLKASGKLQDPGRPFERLDHGPSRFVTGNPESMMERDNVELADDADLLVGNSKYLSDKLYVKTKTIGAQHLNREYGISRRRASCASLPVSSMNSVDVLIADGTGDKRWADNTSSVLYQPQQPGRDTESLTSSSSSSSLGFTDSEDEMLNLSTTVLTQQAPAVPGPAPPGKSEEEVWTSTGGSEQTAHVLDDQGLPIAAEHTSVENFDVPSRISKEGVGAAQIADDMLHERLGEGSVAYSHGSHPLCVAIRSRRHTHGDQNYWSVSDLAATPWCDLVFWHGHCKKGKPTLYVLLGKAVCTLSSTLLGSLVTVIVSNMELAELNLFNGSVEQMNLVIDLSGLGLLRMPPMDILQRLGTLLNRDYAGRGGAVYVLNAPVMLSLVVSAIRGMILRPSYNKGAMIEKGFLESKESISVIGRRYLQVLQKHFEMDMIHPQFGGQCICSKPANHCSVGYDFLARRETD